MFPNFSLARDKVGQLTNQKTDQKSKSQSQLTVNDVADATPDEMKAPEVTRASHCNCSDGKKGGD